MDDFAKDRVRQWASSSSAPSSSSSHSDSSIHEEYRSANIIDISDTSATSDLPDLLPSIPRVDNTPKTGPFSSDASVHRQFSSSNGAPERKAPVASTSQHLFFKPRAGPPKATLPKYDSGLNRSALNSIPPNVYRNAPIHIADVSSSSDSSAIQILSAKDRMLQQIKQENARTGIPIGSPTDPSRAYGTYKSEPKDLIAEKIDEGVSRASLTTDLDETQTKDALVNMFDDLVPEAAQFEVDIDPPDDLQSTLMPHQLQGLKFLVGRETGKKRGGILADDMGLGKTVQMIALILARLPEKRPKATLVVCPVALVDQWISEIKKHVDKEQPLRVYKHHGPGRTKDASKLAKYHVVVTSYETVSSEWIVEPKKTKKNKKKAVPGLDDGSDSDASQVQKVQAIGPLFECEFYRVVLDEAHTIKNKTAKKTKAIWELKSKYRWVLTGTPIQNGVEDLYPLFRFLGIKPFVDFSEFKAKLLDPIKRNRGGVTMDRLRVIFNTHLLRRTKYTKVDGKPLIVLPNKEIISVHTEFEDLAEHEVYDALTNKVEIQINKFLKSDSLMANYAYVLVMMLRLRQCCNHPALIQSTADDKDAMVVTQKRSEDAADEDVDDLAALLGGLGIAKKTCLTCHEKVQSSGRQYCDQCQKDLDRAGAVTSSTKITGLMRVLKEELSKDKTNKVIIFSQFISFFKLLEPYIQKTGYKFVQYNGSMDAKAKAAALHAIREDSKTQIILLSLKCGALGLNLTCCNIVCMMDLWWNPAIENQAIDRAHRYGQTKPVTVYKFTISNTIEDRILVLQEKKQEVANAALEGGSLSKQKLTKQDIMYLFSRDE